jgi:pyruvate dehydrogenase E1 component
MTREAADPDPLETQEWLDAIEDVVDRDGGARAHRLLDAAVGRARAMGVNLPFSATTAYRNTIPVENEPPFPGDAAMELRIRRLNRWNAMAMVVRRNRESSEFGGHIASYASSAVLYDVGLNHFWRIRGPEHGGDLVFFQGHAVPGIYARAFMEGRIDLETLDNFRAETGGKGLSSYPHPWLMLEF